MKKRAVDRKKGRKIAYSPIDLKEINVRNTVLWRVNYILLIICGLLFIFSFFMFWLSLYVVIYFIVYLFAYLHIPLTNMKTLMAIPIQLFWHDFLYMPVYQAATILTAPFQYIFHLYQKATPGEQLTILYLPIGGVIGFFFNQWWQGRKKK